MHDMWDTLMVVVFIALFLFVAWDAWQDCFRDLVADARAWRRDGRSTMWRIVETYNKSEQKWGFQVADRQGNPRGPWFDDLSAVFAILFAVFSVLIEFAIIVTMFVRWPLVGLTAYVGLLVGYGFGWTSAYYGFIAVTVLGAIAMAVIAIVDIGQRVASRFEWRDMGYCATREQAWWTIGFMFAAFVVFIFTNAPRDALYAEVPGDLAVAGRIFGGLFLLVAASIFSTPLRLRPHRARMINI